VTSNHPNSMVGIDNGVKVQRINITKVKRRHDDWHDFPVLPGAPSEGTSEAPVRSVPDVCQPCQPAAGSDFPGGIDVDFVTAPVFVEAMWLTNDKDEVDFLELYTSSAYQSAACAG